jgi:hypothetical protein
MKANSWNDDDVYYELVLGWYGGHHLNNHDRKPKVLIAPPRKKKA